MNMNTDEENRREDFLSRHEGQCIACLHYHHRYVGNGLARREEEYCALKDELLEDIYECDDYKRGW